jgi:CheY-like chemotaxis protein
MAREYRPDLIILDIMMPNVDGYEVIKTLKAAPDTASTRIILSTGIEIDGGRVKALSTGATDYSDFNKLYETVDNILMNEVSV